MHEPEKWHLLLSFIYFSLILLINFIWNLLEGLLRKERVFTTSLVLIFTILSFLLLNGGSQITIDVGYVFLFLTQLIAVGIFLKERNFHKHQTEKISGDFLKPFCTFN